MQFQLLSCGRFLSARESVSVQLCTLVRITTQEQATYDGTVSALDAPTCGTRPASASGQSLETLLDDRMSALEHDGRVSLRILGLLLLSAVRSRD